MKGKYYTMKDVNKMIVIQSVIDKKRTGLEASQALNMSERQIWRLVKKAKEKGIDELKHGNCNKTPKNKISDDIVNKIVKLKKTHDYENANFRHFTEYFFINHPLY